MKNNYTFTLLLSLAVLGGCKSPGITQCPDISTHSLHKEHKIIWAKASPKGVDLKSHKVQANAEVPSPGTQGTAVASSDNDIHIKIKLPALLTRKLESEGEFDNVNKLYSDYSNNKVSLQRNKKGKVFFTATSMKEVLNLSQNMAKLRASSAAYPGGGGGGIAIAAGILGIIGFLMSLGPYIGFASFAVCVVAIVLGVVGLPSPRHGWAVTGIVLGVLGLVFAAILTGVFILVVHIP